MPRERVIFGVELDRETDAAIQKLAAMERRSKRNFHSVLMGRVARLWKESPEELRKLHLIRDDLCHA